MAVGTRKMASENVIVRKLDALVNPSGVTDICSDKTGTLTLETGHDAIEPVGIVRQGNHQKSSIVEARKLDEGRAQAVRAAALCNVSSIHMNLKGECKSTGDPTEVAFQIFATKLGLGQPSLTAGSLIRLADDEEKSNNRFKFLVGFSFSSSIKWMSTNYYDTEQLATIVMCKGANSTDSCVAYVPSLLTKPRDTSPLTEDVKRTFLVKAEDDEHTLWGMEG
ncbi:hypothetical protein F5146DRAFT_1141663 [Armillaria mellea]|nr:hypothetical protein F5146DRAFT_1141663 [Armillaria mellea]